VLVVTSFDNELNGAVGHALDGISVNEDTPGVDLIQEGGPPRGDYLKTHRGRTVWRGEEHLPHLSDQLRSGSGSQSRGKDVVARAGNLARELIRTHQMTPLPEEQDREPDHILKAAKVEKLGG